MADDHGGAITGRSPEPTLAGGTGGAASRAANRHDIHVLNTLLAATLDSADRLARLSEDSDSDGHRHLFAGLAAERRGMAETLEATIVGLGGHPDAGGSILAKTQRAMMDMRHALLGDDADLADAADDGEAALDRRFETALADPKLAATTREILRRTHAVLQVERDDVHALRRGLEPDRLRGNRFAIPPTP